MRLFTCVGICCFFNSQSESQAFSYVPATFLIHFSSSVLSCCRCLNWIKNLNHCHPMNQLKQQQINWMTFRASSAGKIYKFYFYFLLYHLARAHNSRNNQNLFVCNRICRIFVRILKTIHTWVLQSILLQFQTIDIHIDNMHIGVEFGHCSIVFPHWCGKLTICSLLVVIYGLLLIRCRNYFPSIS